MESIPRKTSYLVPSLTLVEEVPEDEHPTERISYLLKQRAGSTGATATTYKVYVHRFCEGTVQQWITLRKAIDEIWTQNGIISPSDRLATVRAILRGESLTIFNATIEELKSGTDDTGEDTIVPTSNESVLAGIHAVAETVFPFRALTNQKLWMRRGMKKPKELSFRKTAAAVGRLNNALPLFPKASATDKFSDEEIVELLEWSIPQSWRTKFDLDGYIPTESNKARLITECEILERNDPQKPSTGLIAKSLKDKAAKKPNVPKHKNGSSFSSEKKASFYCTEHGANPTHNTDSCYTLKNRAKKGNDSATMTKKSFRREINLLSQKRPKQKVMEMFAAVLTEERAKATKKTKSQKAKKRKKKAVKFSNSSTSSESSSDEEEIHVMENFSAKLKKQRKRAGPDASFKKIESNESFKKIESNESIEEKTYLETIDQLGETRDAEVTSESN
jgi:hypothetical protein